MVQGLHIGATEQNAEIQKLQENTSSLKEGIIDLEARNAQLEAQYKRIQSNHSQLKEEITNLRTEMETMRDCNSMKMTRHDLPPKIINKSYSKGPVSIIKADREGKFIALKNKRTQRMVNLDKWKIRRTRGDSRDIGWQKVYTFRNFTLKPGKSVKIFARGAASEAGENDLIFQDIYAWSVGLLQYKTILFNAHGKEIAWHIQKIIYD